MNKFTLEDLRNAPIGTIITTNKHKFVKALNYYAVKFEGPNCCDLDLRDKRRDVNTKLELDNDWWPDEKIIKVEVPTQYKTVFEPILDEKEKEYLSAVIKPFKRRINYISKIQDFPEYVELITFEVCGDAKQGLDCYTVGLPIFKKGTMYNGMELNKRYTIKELGLED